jgi:hypothetical protein
VLTVQDMEFTVQNNKLFMLQTRNGKRTGPAALKVAVDLVAEVRVAQICHPRLVLNHEPFPGSVRIQISLNILLFGATCNFGNPGGSTHVLGKHRL